LVSSNWLSNYNLEEEGRQFGLFDESRFSFRAESGLVTSTLDVHLLKPLELVLRSEKNKNELLF
jgi:hypothetical protein